MSTCGVRITAAMVAGSLAFGCSAGSGRETVYEQNEAGLHEGTTGMDPTARRRTVVPFLNIYYGNVDMFADDELHVDVSEGVVTVTGEVDTDQERRFLTGWISAVPGVRAVDTSAVTVAADAPN